MNQITLPTGYTTISASLRLGASALGTAADALFLTTNSVIDPQTGTGPSKAQTDFGNALNAQITQLQAQADAYEQQGC